MGHVIDNLKHQIAGLAIVVRNFDGQT